MTGTAVLKASWARNRVSIALLALLLYAAASTTRWVRHATHWPSRPGKDQISTYERRFDELRLSLPARGMVGYLGDPEPTGPTPAEADAAALLHFRRYLLAQYSLAPLLLIENTEHEFVVGNFDPGTVPSAPAGLRLVGDFGNGVVLYQRSGR